tara:strand:+ start:829 stop:1143 length:315 start_codon:yes stop_codon:yes gene_type:complete
MIVNGHMQEYGSYEAIAATSSGASALTLPVLLAITLVQIDIEASGSGVVARFRSDGTAATTTVGTPLYDRDTIWSDNVDEWDNLSIIAADASIKLSVTYWKQPD